jgi:hypothetical protein
MFAIEFNLPFGLSFDLVAAADVIAAMVVTAHVLLQKRDVRAAIAWIGLVWLGCRPSLVPLSIMFSASIA